MTDVCHSLIAAKCLWLAGGRVKDRAEPGRRGGAGGVLEVAGRKPDDLHDRRRTMMARTPAVGHTERRRRQKNARQGTRTELGNRPVTRIGTGS